MLPFEFIVDGPPVSHQTRHAARLLAWQRTVRTAATQRWPANTPPVRVRLSFTLTYYHGSNEFLYIRVDVAPDHEELI